MQSRSTQIALTSSVTNTKLVLVSASTQLKMSRFAV